MAEDFSRFEKSLKLITKKARYVPAATLPAGHSAEQMVMKTVAQQILEKFIYWLQPETYLSL
jgi:hypothetical protein